MFIFWNCLLCPQQENSRSYCIQYLYTSDHIQSQYESAQNVQVKYSNIKYSNVWILKGKRVQIVREQDYSLRAIYAPVQR